MLRDTGLDSAVMVSGTLTLDLAGKTITGSDSANAAIAVTGNLTIRDLSLIHISLPRPEGRNPK